MLIKDMNSWRGRLVHVILSCGVLLICAFTYAAFCLRTGYGIPCLFYTVTGLSCPGCGISRMFLNICKMQWYEAFISNPVIFMLLPFAAIYILRRMVIYIRTGTYRENTVTNGFFAVVLVILIVFGVVRNLI